MDSLFSIGAVFVAHGGAGCLVLILPAVGCFSWWFATLA